MKGERVSATARAYSGHREHDRSDQVAQEAVSGARLQRTSCREQIVLFHLGTLCLIIALSSMLLAAMLIGMAAGHWSRNRAAALHEQFGIVQSSVFTVIPLNLAFGLSMSVERFEARQIAVIDDANSIGTAYLRAQTLQEPVRSRSLPLYVSYTDASISLSYAVPGSAKARQAIAVGSMLQRRLWKLAGEALDAEPDTNASRLYV